MGQIRNDVFSLNRMNLRSQICCVCHFPPIVCMCFAVVGLCFLLLSAFLPSVCFSMSCLLICERKCLIHTDDKVLFSGNVCAL